MTPNMNPALLTFKEYHELVNPARVSHDDSAFSKASCIDISHEEKINKFPHLINNFYRNGIHFEMREEVIDRWSFGYTKFDSNNNMIFGENGLAILLSMEEKQERFKDRFKYEYSVFDVTNGKKVAWTQDELGCLLIQSAKEYRGLGIGSKLMKHHMQSNPERETGGETSRGLGIVFRAYQSLVKEHLISGGYRKNYLNGELTFKNINSILESADATSKVRNSKVAHLRERGASEEYISQGVTKPIKLNGFGEIDISMSKPSNLLLHSDSNWAIMYDKTLLDIVQTDNQDKFEHFLSKAIKGYCYIGGTYQGSSTPKLFRLFGQTEEIKATMAEIALNISKNNDSDLLILKRDMPLIEKYLGGKINLTSKENSSMTFANISENTINNLKKLNFREKFIRKDMDKYDEKWTVIQEMAYQLTEDEYIPDKEINNAALDYIN
jgi:GNAT superfamily N-acetyltransferase